MHVRNISYKYGLCARYLVLVVILGLLIIITACTSKEKEQAMSGMQEQIAQDSKVKSVLQKRVISKPKPKPKPKSESESESKLITTLAAHPAAIMMVAPAAIPQPYMNVEENREKYAHIASNPIKRVAEEPVSTFSIDVDTGAYANIRRFINQGQLPPHDAVRIEEMLNYFDYHYPVPSNNKQPFAVHTEISQTPWNANTHLLHIGIQGDDINKKDLPAANLVFLLDVSGSMAAPNKLGLLKASLKMLSKQMDAQDKVSIVVYAGAAGVVLEPTAGNKQAKIIAALDALQAGGSTNGGAGISLAYNLAQQAFIKGGINRVILATDGDFNVGTVDFDELLDLIKEKRQTGIALTSLGFGTGNYNDHLMEQVADAGNGQYAYIDNLNEARKVLVDEMSATLKIIAKDVKIQIEFNPAVVAEYRLLGYENRMLRREDFNNDKIDAGEIGAGHTVTALYEIALVGSKGMSIDPLRYQSVAKNSNSNKKISELAFLRLRYKHPNGQHSQLIAIPIQKQDIIAKLKQTSESFRFAAAVAAFGELLRDSEYIHDFVYDDVRKLAANARGGDEFGYRSEFISLLRTAKELATK